MFKMLRRVKNQKGMSLIEIMIVLGIVAAASAAILNAVMGGSTRARIKQAKIQMGQLEANLSEYKFDKGEYPESLTDLVDAGFYKKTPKDPWNNEWIYEREGNKYRLCSEGADEDTEEDNFCLGDKDEG